MTGADRRLSRTGHFAMDFQCVAALRTFDCDVEYSF